MKRLSLILFLLLNTVALSVQAEDERFYGGLKFARISADVTLDVQSVSLLGYSISGSSFSAKARPTSIYLFAGKTLSRYSAMEINLKLRGGSDTVWEDKMLGSYSLELDSYFDVSFVGLLPVSTDLTIRARLGFAAEKVKDNYDNPGSGTGITLAGGFAYKFNPALTALLEYQRYPIIEDTFGGQKTSIKSNSANIGIMLSF